MLVNAYDVLEMDPRDLLLKCIDNDAIIELQFEDKTITTAWRQTLVSSYFWKMHREYPNTRLYSHCHVQGEYLGPVLQNKLLERGRNDVRASYPEVDMMHLNKLCYSIVDDLHTLVVEELEDYISTLDALDFLQVYRDQAINDIRNKIYESPNKSTVNDIYREVEDVLRNEPRYDSNPIAISLKQGTVKKSQLMQIIALRGFCSEINQKIFYNIIPVGFMEGLTRLSYFAMESRAASIASHATDAPVSDTEFYNRELQIVNYCISKLNFYDCGTRDTIPFKITPFSLSSLVDGKFYVDDDGEVKCIDKNDKSLIGRTLQLRTPAYCEHPDPYTICKYCLGEVAESFQRDANVSYQATVTQNEIITQLTIAIKHYLVSAVSDVYKLDEQWLDYLTNGSNNMEVILNHNLWLNYDVTLKFHRTEINRLADIAQWGVLGKPVDYYSKIREVEVNFTDTTTGEHDAILIPLNHGSVAPSLSFEFLEYMINNNYDNDDGIISVDMANWPSGEVILQYQERRSSVVDMAMEMKSKFFFADSNENKKKSKNKPDSHMRMLGYDLRDPEKLSKVVTYFANEMNRKFNVSLPIIELVLLSIMTRDPDAKDCRTPNKGTPIRLAKHSFIMSYRNLSAKCAYQNQHAMMIDPDNYLGLPTMHHPFDEIVSPTGTRTNDWEERPAETYYGRVLLNHDSYKYKD